VKIGLAAYSPTRWVASSWAGLDPSTLQPWLATNVISRPPITNIIITALSHRIPSLRWVNIR